MRCAVLAAAFALASGFATPVHAADLVGSVVPPYPDGLQEWQGSCLGPTREKDDPCAVSVALLGDADAKITTIIATRLDHHDNAGHAVWQVTDVTAYPRQPDGFTFAMSTCAEDGVPDPSLMAMVRVSDADAWRDATWAVRLDIESGRFEPVDPGRISCTNTFEGG